jgi:ribosomal protein S18 acetylase RimI-like enzyme
MTGLNLRPWHSSDEPYCYDIEIKSYPEPWSVSEFTKNNRSSMVSLVDGQVVGYYCYLGDKILRFAVLPSWRRMGCGSGMMGVLKMAAKRLTTIVPESNSTAQLFLKDMDFRCVNTIKKAFFNLGYAEDGLYFIWRRDDGG